jgi:transcriptional regulator with XRE-family HTH domain
MRVKRQQRPITNDHRPGIFDRITIGGTQIRAARALVGWTIAELAKRAKVGRATIQRAEGSFASPPTARNLNAIEQAFRKEGVDFIDDGEASFDGGRGVRFAKP